MSVCYAAVSIQGHQVRRIARLEGNLRKYCKMTVRERSRGEVSSEVHQLRFERRRVSVFIGSFRRLTLDLYVRSPRPGEFTCCK